MAHNITQDSSLMIFSLDSNFTLAKQIAEKIGGELGAIDLVKFADGEIKISVQESIRGAHVYIVQSTSFPVNDHLMALMIAIDAFRRASAKTINLVMPYFGYGRQDRQAAQREPLTAKLVANMLEMAGANRILTLDLHTNQIQGFFNLPVDHLLAGPLFAEYFIQAGLQGDDIVVVSPDHSSVARSRQLANFLHSPIAIIDRRKMEYNQPAVVNLIGDVRGKSAIIFDDMIDTGETMSYAVEKLKEQGAVAIYLCSPHALLSGDAASRLNAMPIDKIIVSDSIEMQTKKRKILESKLEIVSVAALFAEAITRIHENRPVSPLFLEQFKSR